MRDLVFVMTLVSMICACTKESNADRVVKLKYVDGKYEIICNPISKEDFDAGFQPGWYWEDSYDVLTDGSLGPGYKKYYEGCGGPGRFSVYTENRMKTYFYWEDFDAWWAGMAADHFMYSYIPYTYDESNNTLYFHGNFYSYMTGDQVYYELDKGIVITLNESHMDLVAKLEKYHSLSEDAVYTLFRFKRLTKKTIEKLDSTYREPHPSLKE